MSGQDRTAACICPRLANGDVVDARLDCPVHGPEIDSAATSREQLELFTAAAGEPDTTTDPPRSSQLTELPGETWQEIFKDARAPKP